MIVHQKRAVYLVYQLKKETEALNTPLFVNQPSNNKQTFAETNKYSCKHPYSKLSNCQAYAYNHKWVVLLLVPNGKSRKSGRSLIYMKF